MELILINKCTYIYSQHYKIKDKWLQRNIKLLKKQTKKRMKETAKIILPALNKLYVLTTQHARCKIKV